MSTATVSPARDTRSERPMLTLDGRALLHDRVRWLRDEEIPVMREAAFNDPADWTLRLDLDRAEELLRTLERTLHVADTVPVGKTDISTVEFGDLVTVEFPATDTTAARVARFRIVHPIEARLDDERISVHSPLGQALIGAQVRQTVAVHAPARRYHVHVLSAVRPTLPPGARQHAPTRPALPEADVHSGQPSSRAPRTAT